jgi:hypothetical protein
MIITLDFEKNAIFSPKIVENHITSTPGQLLGGNAGVKMVAPVARPLV